MVIKLVMDAYDYNQDALIFNTLKVLGIIGLIMIVLEAAIDLELSKKKVAHNLEILPGSSLVFSNLCVRHFVYHQSILPRRPYHLSCICCATIYHE